MSHYPATPVVARRPPRRWSLSVPRLRTRPTRAWRTALAASAALLALGVLASPALAHSELETSRPAADTVVDASFDELVLQFKQAIQVLPDDIVLEGSDGPVSSGPAALADAVTVTVPVLGVVGDGPYTVRWRVIGADGHPLEGSYGFAVQLPPASRGTPEPPTAEQGVAPSPGDPTTAGTGPSDSATGTADHEGVVPSEPTGATDDETGVSLSGSASAQERSTPSTSVPSPGSVESATTPVSEVGTDDSDPPGLPRALAVVGRWLMYVGVLLVVGVAAFGIGVHPDVERDRSVLSRLLLGGALLAATASLLQLLARVAVVSGTGMDGAMDSAAIAVVSRGGLLPAVTIRVASAVLIVAASRTPDWWRLRGPGTAVVGAVLGMVASFQLVGHTASSQPELLVRGADAVHVLAAGVWAGGVVALGAVIASRRHRGLESGAIAARFSVVAAAAVVAVGVAGLALAVVELTSPVQLWSTGYGPLLMGKLGVVAVIGAIGLHNHRRLVPAMVQGRTIAADQLRRSILVEAAAFATAIVLTAVLVGLSP